MAFCERDSDLRALRYLVSELFRTAASDGLKSLGAIVTSGSGPIDESDLDCLIKECGGAVTLPSNFFSDQSLVVLGRRDFRPDLLTSLVRWSSGKTVRFVSQEAFLRAFMFDDCVESIEDVEIWTALEVTSHPAFSWMEDRFGWSTWAETVVPKWDASVTADDGAAGGDEGADLAEADGEDETTTDDDEEDDDEEEGGCRAEPPINGVSPADSVAERSQQERDQFVAALRQYGMLKACGYTVGAKSRSDSIRQAQLRRALMEELPSELGDEYITICGAPRTVGRLQKMANSIATFTRNAKRRRSGSLEEAIRHWEMDLAWLKQTWYRPDLGIVWPSTFVA